MRKHQVGSRHTTYFLNLRRATGSPSDRARIRGRVLRAQTDPRAGLTSHSSDVRVCRSFPSRGKCSRSVVAARAFEKNLLREPRFSPFRGCKCVYFNRRCVHMTVKRNRIKEVRWHIRVHGEKILQIYKSSKLIFEMSLFHDRTL